MAEHPPELLHVDTKLVFYSFLEKQKQKHTTLSFLSGGGGGGGGGGGTH